MLISRVICNCFLWCLAPFCHIKKYIAYVKNLKKKILKGWFDSQAKKKINMIVI